MGDLVGERLRSYLSQAAHDLPRPPSGPSMEVTDRARLGTTDVYPTRLGLGLAPIAGLFTAVPDAQAIATIDRAWEQGIRLFDTAPVYGYGRSEHLAGQALSRRPREELVLSTKIGRRLATGEGPGREPAGEELWSEPAPDVTPYVDFSGEGVRASLSESRDRLHGLGPDIVHIHDPDEHWTEAANGAYEALAALREQGAVHAVSAGMNQAAMLARFVRERRMDAVLVAGRYTLLDQSAATELLPACLARGVGVLIGGVYNSGLLADPRPGATYDYAPASPELVGRAQAIAAICQGHGVPLRAAAIQFPFRHPAVTSVLVGARSPGEVDEAVSALRHPVPEALWATLREEGFIGDTHLDG